MQEGLVILFSMSLVTLMTVAYRHQDLAPAVLGSIVKLGILVGLAIPAYLFFFAPNGVGQSAPSGASLSGVSNEFSLREALSMISCMILGALGMSAFLVQVRRMGTHGEQSSSVGSSQKISDRNSSSGRYPSVRSGYRGQAAVAGLQGTSFEEGTRQGSTSA